MASLNLATFILPSTHAIRYVVHLKRGSYHVIFDLKPHQDLFLRRVIHADPKTLPNFSSTIYLATIPLPLVGRLTELLLDAMGGEFDDDIDYVEEAKNLAGTMTIMEGGGCSALFCLEDLLLEQVLRIQIEIIAKLIRGEDLVKGEA